MCLEWMTHQAIPGAVARVRDQRGQSPAAASEFLLGVLEQGVPGGGALYDERATTAAFIAALGCLRCHSPEVGFSKQIGCWHDSLLLLITLSMTR